MAAQGCRSTVITLPMPRVFTIASQIFVEVFMKHRYLIGVALTIIARLGVSGVFAQQAPVKMIFDVEIRAALESAKTAAGSVPGHLGPDVSLSSERRRKYHRQRNRHVTNPASAPARNTWYAEPAKVFDNLYFVGGKLHSAWALTTREGIILIDTIYPYNSEELIIGGMRKVGLDPKNIKYVIISHAHGDHIGGAEMLQTRYGARVVMGGQIGIWSKYQIATRPWRRNASSPPTV
jgi:metallo-beta-lactamase class B